MFTAAPRLTIRRPSPTTIGFSVSNAPTLPHSLSHLLLALRMSVLLLSIAGILLKYTFADSEYLYSNGGSFQTFSSLIGRHGFLKNIVDVILSYPWPVVGPILLATAYFCCRRFHTEESLLVLQSLGIQTSTSSNMYLSSATTRFIPTSEIQDIFIHEAFIGFEVRYYLAVVAKDEPEMIVVFSKLLPRRAILEEVWRGARACLFANLLPGPTSSKLASHSRMESTKS